MKTLLTTTLAVMLLSAAPVLAMGCCGAKGKAAMCAKSSGMAMNMKGKKGGCCCEGMAGGMTKRG